MGVITPFPSPDAIARAERLTRERFVYEGETLEEALAPGSPRRRALDAAILEVDAGHQTPSVPWRREFSLLLGLERILSEEEPHLVDGTVLSAHQVDALSGTLTALMAEVQRSGNGNAPTAEAELEELEELEDEEDDPGFPVDSRAAEPTAEEDEDEDEDDDDPLDEVSPQDEDDEDDEEDAAPEEPEDEEPQDWHDEADEEEPQLGEQPEDPNAAKRFWFEHATGAGKTVAALGFVEASHTGRRTDPHPPPQSRRPVPRRAARSRVPRPHHRRAARRPGRRQRPGDGRDLPVVRPQRRAHLRRLHDRHLRRGAHRPGREDLGLDPRLGRP